MERDWYINESNCEALMQKFLAGRATRADWTHEAHLVAALWHLRQMEEAQAMVQLREAIIRHNEAVGTPNTDTGGYHETLTWFWVCALGEFLRQVQATDLSTAVDRLLGSEWGSPGLPLRFWDHGLLMSTPARRSWVPPNLEMPVWLQKNP